MLAVLLVVTAFLHSKSLHWVQVPVLGGIFLTKGDILQHEIWG